MQVPSHLRLTLFCAKVYTVVALEGRAWVCGAKDEIDLDMENVQELVDLGILEINPRPQTGGEGMIGAHVVRSFGSRTAGYMHKDPLDDAFVATFADGVLPEHPGLYLTGDEATAKYITYETHETFVDGSVKTSEGNFVRAVETVEPVIRSEYGEAFFLTKSHPVGHEFPHRYKRGEVGPCLYMDGSMLSTLRCVIEHDVYSAGHMWVKRLDGGPIYDRVMDASGLYGMMRFGLIEASRPLPGGGEHYQATDLGLRVYDQALPHLAGMRRLDRWQEVAKGMGWDD